MEQFIWLVAWIVMATRSNPEGSGGAPTWYYLLSALGGGAGIFSLGLYLKQRWDRREASVGARLERFEGDHGVRLVITNYGPHPADGVGAELQARGGGQPVGLPILRSGTTRDLPIPRLHAGESYYVYGLYRTINAEPPQAVLTWSDRRRGRQTRTVYLSVHPVGPRPGPDWDERMRSVIR